jgi:ABC-type multidrug transport system permease subunit
MITDRFQGRLKLLITMPMSRGAYVFGMMAYVSVQTVITVTLLLTIGWLVGVNFSLSWSFAPLLAVLILTMAGVTLFIASYAPSAEAGSIMGNVFGILLVMISPVFFTIDRAPLVLKWLGWISPLRYAADGMAKSLSGNTDVLIELAILAGFALLTLGTGIWKLRWREK